MTTRLKSLLAATAFGALLLGTVGATTTTASAAPMISAVGHTAHVTAPVQDVYWAYRHHHRYWVRRHY